MSACVRLCPLVSTFLSAHCGQTENFSILDFSTSAPGSQLTATVNDQFDVNQSALEKPSGKSLPEVSEKSVKCKVCIMIESAMSHTALIHVRLGCMVKRRFCVRPIFAT